MSRKDRFGDLARRMLRCRRCGLGRGVHAVLGRFDDPRWMLVGQAPGEREAALGRPFAGPAGRRLFGWLADAGFAEDEFRSRCYVTAMMKCFPGKGVRGDLRPSRRQLEDCSRFLAEEIELVQPEVLIPVGGLAIERFLGKRPLAEVIGRRFLVEHAGRVLAVVPLPHPSGASAWTNQARHRTLLRRALGLLELARHWQLPGPAQLPSLQLLHCRYLGSSREDGSEQGIARARPRYPLSLPAKQRIGRSFGRHAVGAGVLDLLEADIRFRLGHPVSWRLCARRR